MRIATTLRSIDSMCLTAGREVTHSAFLYCGRDSQLDTARVVFALAEPVQPVVGQEDIAAQALRVLRREINGIAVPDVIERLHLTFGTLNDWLIDANRVVAPSRRIYLGLTAIVCGNDELYVAQVPPGQAFIRQERKMYAFPSIDGRLSDDEWSCTANLPKPLGLAPGLEPLVYYSRLERGDLLSVLSSPLARRLGAASDELSEAANTDDWLDTLMDLADRRNITEAQVAVAIA